MGEVGGRVGPQYYWYYSLIYLHPSPTTACAQLQPMTLETGPNGPKQSPFTFRKGLGTFWGGNPFSPLLGPTLAVLGARPLAASGPKRAQMAPKKANVGLSEAVSGPKRAADGPHMPCKLSQRVPDHVWAKPFLGPKLGTLGVLCRACF